MTEKSNFTALIRENKTLFIIITVGLFLIELEIFAIAAIKSGRQSRLQVSDNKGSVIYETDGDRLSDFNKYYFEKTFGPFENYNVKLVTKEIPFPFRAWFVAAVGIPIGAVLLFGFVFKAYMTLVQGEKTSRAAPGQGPVEAGTHLEQVLDRVGRLNIFTIGFLVFTIIISYWIIPNTLTTIGKIGIEAFIRYKWLFLAAAAAFLGTVLWIIYLRYLLAKKAIDSQVEIDKYRLRLEHQPAEVPEQLEYHKDMAADSAVIEGEIAPDHTLEDREG